LLFLSEGDCDCDVDENDADENDADENDVEEANVWLL